MEIIKQEQTNDYLIKIRLYNNLLLKKIKDDGFKTLISFARYAKISPTTFYPCCHANYEIFTKRGHLKSHVVKLCKIFNCEPKDIFPPTASKFEIRKEFSKGQALEMIKFINTFEVNKPELQQLQQPDLLLEKEEKKKTLKKILATLTPREEKVINMRYGLNGYEEESLEEVSKSFNVTRERIRQIEAKALRKLRHPSRKNRLMGEEYNIKEKKNKTEKTKVYSSKSTFKGSDRLIAIRKFLYNMDCWDIKITYYDGQIMETQMYDLFQILNYAEKHNFKRMRGYKVDKVSGLHTGHYVKLSDFKGCDKICAERGAYLEE